MRKLSSSRKRTTRTRLLRQPIRCLLWGTLTSWDNSFHWTGIPGATWYLIQVQDAGGTAIKSKWVSTSSTCTGLNCSYVWSDIGLANGSYQWRIQVYGSYGAGTVVMSDWYSSSTNCGGGTTCAVTPTETLELANGDYKWRILDYGPYGYGTWTDFQTFTLNQ